MKGILENLEGRHQFGKPRVDKTDIFVFYLSTL
jgi:hypothetical protein